MDVRERVFIALREMVRSRGLAAVTMDELAQAAGVSKRTIYRYFTGKAQVIEEMTDQMMLGIDEEIRTIMAGKERPREKLHLLIDKIHQKMSLLEMPALSDLQKQYPEVWEKIDAFRSAKVNLLSEFIAEGIASGDFRPMDPAVAAACLVAMARTIINPSFIMTHSLSITEAFQTVYDLFLYGVTLPPPGQ